MATGMIATVSAMVEQKLMRRVDYIEKDNSPVYKRIVGTSQGVMQQAWGNDWLIRKIFRTGLAGSIDPGRGIGYSQAASSAAGSVLNAALATADTAAPNFNIYGTGVQQVWPGAGDSPSPGWFQWQVNLRKSLGSMFIPVDLIRTAELGASIGDQLEATVDATAENIALFKCNAFMADGAIITAKGASGFTLTLSDGVLGTSVAVSSGSLTTGTSITVTLEATSTSGGSIRRFADGQRVSLIGATATDDQVRILNTAGALYVSSVDGLANTFKLVNVTGSTVTIETTAGYNRFAIVPYKAFNGVTVEAANDFYETGAAVALTAARTVESWLPHGYAKIFKASGEVYGTGVASTGIDVARHPFAKSYIPAALGSALDENQMLRYLARITHARPTNLRPDLWAFSEGALAALFGTLSSSSSYMQPQVQRNGQKLDMSQLGTDGVVKVYFGGGFSAEIVADPWIGHGKCIGFVTRNGNFKQYTAPRMPNAGSKAGFDPLIEWASPILGSAAGIFQGTRNTSGQSTDMLEAPFSFYYQIVPDIIPGVVLSGLSEDYGATG